MVVGVARDPSLPPVFHRRQALAAGVTPHQIAQRVRSGSWLALRRQVYTLASGFTALPARDQHVLRLVATLMTRGETHVASHLSGAVVHGWGLPHDGPGPVTITSGDLSRSARRRERLVVQVATLLPSDVRTSHVTAAGQSWLVRVTSMPRTLADCLRHLPIEDSVAIGDAVLRSGQFSWDSVCRVLDRQEPWPYLARGRQALALLDPRRESYLESFSFVRLWQRGLAMPEPQVTIRDAEGRFVARVDGWIADSAVALEADGLEKYLMGPTGAVKDSDPREIAKQVRRSVLAQSAREERLRELGVTVVRWGTADALHRPDDLVARIRRACDLAARGFTGTATPLKRPHWIDGGSSSRRAPRDLSAIQSGFWPPKAG
jgi:hypothetical protein